MTESASVEIPDRETAPREVATRHNLTDQEFSRRRHSRQEDLVPTEMLETLRAVVVGVGAVGRQVALQLTAVGVPFLVLVDHDGVEVENLASQGFRETDLGQMKVRATADSCLDLNPRLRVEQHPQRFSLSRARQIIGPPPVAVFCCVDKMKEGRMIVWEGAQKFASFFVDGRLGGETIRVLAVAETKLDTYYATTLFDDIEAHPGRCTAKTTIYTASITAGIMISQMSHWMRGLPVERCQTLNLLAADLMVD